MVADSLWSVRRGDRLARSNCSACWPISSASTPRHRGPRAPPRSHRGQPFRTIGSAGPAPARSPAWPAATGDTLGRCSAPSRRPSFSTSHPAGPRFWSGPDLPLRRYRWAVGSGRAHRWRRCWRSAERLRPGAHRSGHRAAEVQRAYQRRQSESLKKQRAGGDHHGGKDQRFPVLDAGRDEECSGECHHAAHARPAHHEAVREAGARSPTSVSRRNRRDLAMVTQTRRSTITAASTAAQNPAIRAVDSGELASSVTIRLA